MSSSVNMCHHENIAKCIMFYPVSMMIMITSAWSIISVMRPGRWGHEAHLMSPISRSDIIHYSDTSDHSGLVTEKLLTK